MPYGDGLKATKFSCRPDGINYAGATPIWFDLVAETIADVYYETPATQLVQDANGAVTGVICQSKDGYEQFNAAKGVILCTGDYQNDNEMVSYFLPDLANAITKQSGKTGDGIKMGFWAGGVIEPVHHTKMSHDFGSGPMANEPFLYVDGNGKRFCSEGIHLSLMSNFLRFTDTSTWFQIFDSSYQENVASWNGEIKTPEELAPFIPEDEEWAGRGQVHRADTLEELASLLGIEDVDTFLATVERYNELCNAGADDDFGKDPAYMKAIVTAPFYGTKRDTGITAICAGLLTDGNQRVIDADGNPIPGLYAAGNTSGGFFGAVDYPFVGEYIDAISIGRCVSGGYAAAQHAANL